jgi:hypothetical protein
MTQTPREEESPITWESIFSDKEESRTLKVCLILLRPNFKFRIDSDGRLRWRGRKGYNNKLCRIIGKEKFSYSIQ